MDLRSMIGWFGALLAAACLMVGMIALYFAITTPKTSGPGPDDLLVPIAMLFMKPIGLATMAAGAVGLFWPAEIEPGSHNFRCWIALLGGGAATALSFTFGPTF